MNDLAKLIIAAVIGFIILLGAIGVGFYFIILEHPTIQTTRDFLKNNQRLKQDIGEIKEVKVSPKKLAYYWATTQFEVTGDKKSFKGIANLNYRNKWEVTGAYYYNPEVHRSINLLE